MTTYTLNEGNIIITTITETQHNAEQLLATLNAQKADIEAGKEAYLLDVNARLEGIQAQINEIQNLLA